MSLGEMRADVVEQFPHRRFIEFSNAFDDRLGARGAKNEGPRNDPAIIAHEANGKSFDVHTGCFEPSRSAADSLSDSVAPSAALAAAVASPRVGFPSILLV